MHRKNFKRIGDKLAFNTPQADPIFVVLQELETGYMYIMESTPFGPVQFVHRNLVDEPEDEVVEEKAAKTTKK